MKVEDAKALAKKYDLDGVIIIGISLPEETMPSVSYGRNRQLCRHFAVVLDKILADIESGKIRLCEEEDGDGEA